MFCIKTRLKTTSKTNIISKNDSLQIAILHLYKTHYLLLLLLLFVVFSLNYDYSIFIIYLNLERLVHKNTF